MRDAFGFEFTDRFLIDRRAHHIAIHHHEQRVPLTGLEIERETFGLALEQRRQLGRFVARQALFADGIVHAAGLFVGQVEVFQRHVGEAEMAGVHGRQPAVDEIDPEIVPRLELEAQPHRAILKRHVVKNRHAVIGHGRLGHVQGAILERGLLRAFRAPGAVRRPAIADLFLVGRRLVALEVVFKKRRAVLPHESVIVVKSRRSHGEQREEDRQWKEEEFHGAMAVQEKLPGGR